MPSGSPLSAGSGLRPHLVADKELALPQGAGDVMDGQAQVVVTVLEVQDAGLLDQLPTQLLLQLHHLLQCQVISRAWGLREPSPLPPKQGTPCREPWAGSHRARAGEGPYLECIVGVVQAVDADVVLEGGAGHRGKQKQLEALGSSHTQGLSHQGEAAQLLGEDVAGAGLQLAVVEVGGCLLAQVQHVLWAGRWVSTTQSGSPWTNLSSEK